MSAAVRIRVNPAATENLAWHLLAGARRSLPSVDQKPTAACQQATRRMQSRHNPATKTRRLCADSRRPQHTTKHRRWHAGGILTVLESGSMTPRS